MGGGTHSHSGAEAEITTWLQHRPAGPEGCPPRPICLPVLTCPSGLGPLKAPAACPLPRRCSLHCPFPRCQLRLSPPSAPAVLLFAPQGSVSERFLQLRESLGFMCAHAHSQLLCSLSLESTCQLWKCPDPPENTRLPKQAASFRTKGSLRTQPPRWVSPHPPLVPTMIQISSS